MPRLSAAIAASGAKGAVIDFDDRFWPEASGLAQALINAGIPFRVHASAAWLFRPRNAFDGTDADREFLERYKPIRLRVAQAPGDLPLPDDGRTLFLDRQGPVAVTLE